VEDGEGLGPGGAVRGQIIGVGVVNGTDLVGVHELEDVDGVGGLLLGLGEISVGKDHVEVLAILITLDDVFGAEDLAADRAAIFLLNAAAAGFMIEVKL
jgi:hypothetical protein